MSEQTNLKPPSALTTHIYRLLTVGAVGLIAVGTVVYRALEDWSWVDSFYFSVVTITTVGFGDLAPKTDGAKLFTVFYILTGISIIATFLDARMKFRAQRRNSRTHSS